MLPPELAQVAALHVPGSGPVDISQLRNGLVNTTYRVVRDGRCYALRVAGGSPRALGLDWGWELRVLRSAAAAQLAPRIEYADAQHGVLVLQWAEGRQWGGVEVVQEENIGRIAGLLRAIHALPAPRPARLMRPAQWIELYGASVRSPDRTLAVASAAKLDLLGSLPGVPDTLCHSDLHVFNLIDRGDSLVLLDWEYAHLSDPLWDLAGWSANNDLAADDVRRLHTAYAGREPSTPERLRLRTLCWLYDYVCLLWSVLYLSLRGAGEAPDGLARRAEVLQYRLAQTM